MHVTVVSSVTGATQVVSWMWWSGAASTQGTGTRDDWDLVPSGRHSAPPVRDNTLAQRIKRGSSPPQSIILPETRDPLGPLPNRVPTPPPRHVLTEHSIPFGRRYQTGSSSKGVVESASAPRLAFAASAIKRSRPATGIRIALPNLSAGSSPRRTSRYTDFCDIRSRSAVSAQVKTSVPVNVSFYLARATGTPVSCSRGIGAVCDT